jgi:16S rRNA (guanine966-N2)-methyltransferase
MSALGGRLDGLEVVDLFAGSGALGLEALSRGARRAVFVERARGALRTLEENVRTLGAGDRAQVVKGDALEWAGRQTVGAFDLALADPPYGRGFAARLLSVWRDRPFARELWVEHRTDEELGGPIPARQRRYGDTTLTTVRRDDPTDDPTESREPEA